MSHLIIVIIVRGMSRPAAAFSLQSVTERFRGLPSLLIADVGVADRGADILVAKHAARNRRQFLDFPQILSHVIEQNCRRGMPQPVRGDLPHPEGFALNARLENGAPEYPANTNSAPAKAIPPGARMRRPLKRSWMAFQSRSVWLKLQGGRERKTPGIEIRSGRPGQKPYPYALISREAVSRKVPAPRSLEEIGRKPLNVAPLGAVLYISHEHGGIF
jgi:hypothetical protein